MRGIALTLFSAVLSLGLAADEPPGVVVEEVMPGFAAAEAGLKPGDLLLRWRRAATPPANPEAASGAIGHPFDIWEVEVDEAPRGALTLFGERAGEKFVAPLPPGRWRIKVRPRLSTEDLKIYTEGRMLASSGKVEQVQRALERWRQLEESWEGDRPAQASWLLFEMLELAHRHELEDRGEASFMQGLEPAADGRSTKWMQELRRQWGETLENSSLWHRMVELYHASIGVQEGESPAIASCLRNLGDVLWNRRDLSAAEAYYQRSLTIEGRVAPGGLHSAESLTRLGVIALSRRNLSAAQTYHELALTIRKKLAPGSLRVRARITPADRSHECLVEVDRVGG